VGQEAGGLYNLVQTGTGSLQNGAHVFAAPLSLSSDALGHGAGGGVDRQLARGDHQITHNKAMRVGADGAGSVFGIDNSHDRSPPWMKSWCSRLFKNAQ